MNSDWKDLCLVAITVIVYVLFAIFCFKEKRREIGIAFIILAVVFGIYFFCYLMLTI